MRVAGELVLEVPRDWVADFGESVARTGDGFQFVGDFSCCGVETEQESFLALFHVLFGRRVHKTKLRLAADRLHDAAQVGCPKAEGVNLDGNELVARNWRGRIHDADPAEIEHRPVGKGALGRGKCCFSVPKAGLAFVEREVTPIDRLKTVLDR